MKFWSLTKTLTNYGQGLVTVINNEYVKTLINPQFQLWQCRHSRQVEGVMSVKVLDKYKLLYLPFLRKYSWLKSYMDEGVTSDLKSRCMRYEVWSQNSRTKCLYFCQRQRIKIIQIVYTFTLTVLMGWLPKRR